MILVCWPQLDASLSLVLFADRFGGVLCYGGLDSLLVSLVFLRRGDWLFNLPLLLFGRLLGSGFLDFLLLLLGRLLGCGLLNFLGLFFLSLRSRCRCLLSLFV